MSIALMICFARSGGTLLNRCLASCRDVVMLSEVNPLRRPHPAVPLRTVRQQAEAWYGITLASDDYVEGIRELMRICESRGKHLVVRDWPVIDFVPIRENGFKPPRRFTSTEVLSDIAGVSAFGFVRDAIDVWISNGSKRGFFRGYLAYVRALASLGIPLFRYEDFCADPQRVLTDICAAAGLPAPGSVEGASGYANVTGDVAGSSRGARAGTATVLPRRRLPGRDVRWVNASEDMRAANALLGYGTCYEDRPREPWLRGMATRCHAHVKARLAPRGERHPGT